MDKGVLRDGAEMLDRSDVEVQVPVRKLLTESVGSAYSPFAASILPARQQRQQVSGRKKNWIMFHQ